VAAFTPVNRPIRIFNRLARIPVQLGLALKPDSSPVSAALMPSILKGTTVTNSYRVTVKVTETHTYDDGLEANDLDNILDQLREYIANDWPHDVEDTDHEVMTVQLVGADGREFENGPIVYGVSAPPRAGSPAAQRNLSLLRDLRTVQKMANDAGFTAVAANYLQPHIEDLIKTGIPAEAQGEAT
jgi:hypothetical protein